MADASRQLTRTPSSSRRAREMRGDAMSGAARDQSGAGAGPHRRGKAVGDAAGVGRGDEIVDVRRWVLLGGVRHRAGGVGLRPPVREGRPTPPPPGGVWPWCVRSAPRSSRGPCRWRRRRKTCRDCCRTPADRRAAEPPPRGRACTAVPVSTTSPPRVSRHDSAVTLVGVARPGGRGAGDGLLNDGHRFAPTDADAEFQRAREGDAG